MAETEQTLITSTENRWQKHSTDTDNRKLMTETQHTLITSAENSRNREQTLDRNTEGMLVTFVNLHKSAGVGGAGLILGQPLQEVCDHTPFLGRLHRETSNNNYRT